jgi:hypothetical protein
MRGHPTGKLWMNIMIFCVGVLGCAFTLNHCRRDLKGSVEGLFAEKYLLETETRHGNEIKRYHMSYSFTVNGKLYHGAETQEADPVMQECTVYFDPHDPETNALTQDPVDKRIAGLGIALGAVTFLALFALLAALGRNARSTDATDLR